MRQLPFKGYLYEVSLYKLRKDGFNLLDTKYFVSKKKLDIKENVLLRKNIIQIINLIEDEERED